MTVSSSKRPPGGAAKRRAGIVCATDFGAESQRMAEAAASIASKLGEPLLLAHAIEVPALGSAREQFAKWMTTSSKTDLKKQADLLRKGGVEVKTHLTPGRADEVLCEIADTESPRMIVTASKRRRGAVDRWLLGSVIERTAQQAKIPTVVAREPESLTAWAHGDRPLKIFVCFNFTATAEAALRWVKDLRAVGKIEVVIGYVDWPCEEQLRLGASGPLPLDQNPPEVQAALERDLRARAGEVLGKIPFRVRVEPNWGRTDLQLARIAKEEGVDLLVVGSHQYNGFERLWHTSISRGLLHEAEMNLAIVPRASNRGQGPEMAPPVRRVLVSTDFSDESNAAIAHAYSIVRGGGAVLLVHVVPPPIGIPGGDSGAKAAGASAGSRKIQQCAAKLRELIPAEAVNQRIVTQVEVIESRDVAAAICQAAERLRADVICLSSHGRSGLAKTVLGSVAAGVMQQSRRPLFVVRPEI